MNENVRGRSLAKEVDSQRSDTLVSWFPLGFREEIDIFLYRKRSDKENVPQSAKEGAYLTPGQRRLFI